MITACKAYITDNGSHSIWDQPQQAVAEKIRAAINLNQVLDTTYWQTDMCTVLCNVNQLSVLTMS